MSFGEMKIWNENMIWKYQILTGGKDTGKVFLIAIHIIAAVLPVKCVFRWNENMKWKYELKISNDCLSGVSTGKIDL